MSPMAKPYLCGFHSSCLFFIMLCVFSLQIFLINYITVLIRNKNLTLDNSHILHSFKQIKGNITISALEIENLNIKIRGNKPFYKIENNPKYFRENEHFPHLDHTYGNNENELSSDAIHETLRFLFIEFRKYINHYNYSHNISNYSNALYWIEYGSLLGSWRDKDIIEWDDDGDIGIFESVLSALPITYESNQGWIFQRNPNINAFIYDSHNTVSGRIISQNNGVFIDLFAYSMIVSESGQKYVYNSWSINNFDFWQCLHDLLPLCIDCGVFFNHSFNIPQNTKKWLDNEYPNGLEKPVWNYYDWNDTWPTYDYWYETGPEQRYEQALDSLDIFQK